MYWHLLRHNYLPVNRVMKYQKNLRPFQIYHQDHATDKFSSMAVCIKSTLTMVNQEYIPSLNALKFVLLQNSNTTISLFFFYCIERTILMSPQYLEAMAYTLHSFEIDAVLGDFNMNYLSENSVSIANVF